LRLLPTQRSWGIPATLATPAGHPASKCGEFMRTLLLTAVCLTLMLAANAQNQNSFAAGNANTGSSFGSLSNANNANPAAVSNTASPKQPAQRDPLLDPPPLPRAKVSLIGGTVMRVDDVLNRITIRPFGAKKNMGLNFDTRTDIVEDGKPAAEWDIKPGQRVYIDSQLDGTRVFARSIRIQSLGASGSGYGQILNYDARTNTLTLRDQLSAQPVHFRLSAATVVRNGTAVGSTADLQPGSLVSLVFANQQERNVVKEVSLLAQPGAVFSFFGTITFVDLSRNLIAVSNQADNKAYEIHLGSVPPSILNGLHEGTTVGISAVFDGNQYVARNVSLQNSNPSQD